MRGHRLTCMFMPWESSKQPLAAVLTEYDASGPSARWRASRTMAAPRGCRDCRAHNGKRQVASQSISIL